MTNVENNISEQKEVVNKPEKVYKTKVIIKDLDQLQLDGMQVHIHKVLL
jgi:hypothetical protein